MRVAFNAHRVIIFACLLYRLQLAALHFNENANRAQARNRDGALEFVLRFPKFRKGACTVGKVMTQQTFGKYSLKIIT